MSDTYDAANRTKATLAEAEAAVGKRATLTLTGEITEAGESGAGAFVMFKVDQRWGLGEYALGFDLEALDVEGQ